MFFNRKKELNSLNDLYLKRGFQFLVMYGRRRIGKTSLLKEFSKNKNSIFFVAEEYNDKLALEKFSNQILEHFKMNDYLDSFTSWEKAFRFIGEKALKNKLVLIIDEFPYIANSNKSLISLLQNLIDNLLQKTNLFLIICGSSMSFMEKEILSYKSPLFGRRTSQMEVKPFDIFESSLFSKSYSNKDKIINYGILGGTPQYLNKFDYSISVKENIVNNFMNRNSYLFDEPKHLLKQELREPSLYNSIIESIANGYTKLNEISTKIGEKNDKTAKYLKTLIDIHLVEKELPILDKKTSRKSIYKLKDNMFKFYYRFIFSNYSLIEQEMYDYVFEKKVEPFLNQYMGFVFEDVSIQFLTKLNFQKKLPFVFEKIGRWWGHNPVRKRQEEIDILAFSNKSALFGECKWYDKKVGVQTYEQLKDKSNIFDFSEKYFVIFSKSGFERNLSEISESNDNLLLFDLNDFFKG